MSAIERPGLNSAQQAAVRYIDGPLLVLAGAGSGKTSVISEKVTWLVDSGAYEARHIAAITFTNKAAHEMRTRVAGALSAEVAQRVHVSTFHALGLRIVREEAKTLGFKPRFSILDASDCLSLIGEIAGGVDQSARLGIQSQISRWKSTLLDAQGASKAAENELQARAAQVYLSYEATMRAYQAVDFDDLILLPTQLFASRNAILDKWQDRLRYLLVDEYQDTNTAQYQLLRQLAGVRAQLTAVGDDDQAIYAWRGADIHNLRRLGVDYPALKLVKLEQNYRSTTRILQAANALISHNEKLYEKRLWSDLGHGEAIRVRMAPDPEKEAEKVVMQLQGHKFRQSARFADYAVLYRSNHQARFVEQYLRQERVPYVISGGPSFFERVEIKDLFAYLRLLLNNADDPAFIRAVRAPRRGIGTQTLAELGAYAGERHLSLFAAAQEHGIAARIQAQPLEAITRLICLIKELQRQARHESPGKVLDYLISEIHYKAYLFEHEEPHKARLRWKHLSEFCEWLAEKGDDEQKTLLELTQNISLLNRLDDAEAASDAVQLSTLHAAKGLEFKHVFLIGVEEALLPHRESATADEIEEERRLMYVGVTRAERTLNISYCQRRKQGRESWPCRPSRFIAELGSDIQRPDDEPKALEKVEVSARLAAMKAMLEQGRAG